jgi:hypothetical protein
MGVCNESWEMIHKRLMQEFWSAMNAQNERIQSDQPDTPDGSPSQDTGPANLFDPPPGFPEGSREFFNQMAHVLIRVQMEAILRNMADGVMTAVAKELSPQAQESRR